MRMRGRAVRAAGGSAGRGWQRARVGGPTWGLEAGGGMRIERLATSVSVPEPIPRSACGKGAL